MDVFVSQFILYLLLFARITSMIVVAPIVGHQAIPVQVKVSLGMFLAFVMFPLLSVKSPQMDVQLLELVVLLLQEVAVGLLIGFAAGLLFAGVHYAGEIIALHMGLSFANIIDPESNQSNPVIGQLLYLTTLLIFLVLNGHHFLIQALHLSYTAVPIGAFVFSMPAAKTLASLAGLVFVIGVKFSAPILVAIFLNNVGFAILARVMPQMNIFSISFPLNIGVGLLVLMSTAPLVVYVFKKSLESFEYNILELINVL